MPEESLDIKEADSRGSQSKSSWGSRHEVLYRGRTFSFKSSQEVFLSYWHFGYYKTKVHAGRGAIKGLSCSPKITPSEGTAAHAQTENLSPHLASGPASVSQAAPPTPKLGRPPAHYRPMCSPGWTHPSLKLHPWPRPFHPQASRRELIFHRGLLMGASMSQALHSKIAHLWWLSAVTELLVLWRGVPKACEHTHVILASLSAVDTLSLKVSLFSPPDQGLPESGTVVLLVCVSLVPASQSGHNSCCINDEWTCRPRGRMQLSLDLKAGLKKRGRQWEPLLSGRKPSAMSCSPESEHVLPHTPWLPLVPS